MIVPSQVQSGPGPNLHHWHRDRDGEGSEPDSGSAWAGESKVTGGWVLVHGNPSPSPPSLS
eukprot:2016150-Rhodomonas_salina.1